MSSTTAQSQKPLDSQSPLGQVRECQAYETVFVTFFVTSIHRLVWPETVVYQIYTLSSLLRLWQHC